MSITKQKKDVVIILPDIRSSYNVGSIFRTAEASGVSKIYLSGYTPTPINKYSRSDSGIAKTALGAEKIIPWEYYKTTTSVINKLKKEGYKIISVEQSKNSINYKKYKITNKTVFIFGNEVNGLPKSILNKSDVILEIPMMGNKESLNVSVTAGVILFEYNC